MGCCQLLLTGAAEQNVFLPSPARDGVVQYRKLCRLMALASAVWGASYARYALNPLQEALRGDLALTDNQIALIQGPAIALPALLCTLPLGVLVDRFSRTHLLAAFALLEFAASALTAVTHTLTLLFIARLLVGVAVAGAFLGSRDGLR